MSCHYKIYILCKSSTKWLRKSNYSIVEVKERNLNQKIQHKSIQICSRRIGSVVYRPKQVPRSVYNKQGKEKLIAQHIFYRNLDDILLVIIDHHIRS
jgi:hypothetical protein